MCLNHKVLTIEKKVNLCFNKNCFIFNFNYIHMLRDKNEKDSDRMMKRMTRRKTNWAKEYLLGHLHISVA